MKSSYLGRTWRVSWIWVRPLFGCVLAAGFGLGQTVPPPPGSDTGLNISVDVKLVVLNVSVRNKRGGMAPRLQERNFRLEENGQPQAIRAFQAVDTPVAVGLVVDSSRSMQTKRPEVAEAAAAFVRLSDPRDEIFLVNFNEKVNFSFPDTKLLATSPAKLTAALLNPVATGQTALYDAIGSALAHIRTSRIERKVLLVISDGGDNASKATQAGLLQEVARPDVEIYTIGLFDEEDPDHNAGVLRKIAGSSGGQAFQPRLPGEAVRICEQIARDIRTQYVVSYSPANQNFCGEYRAIKLRVTTDRGARLAVRTRAGYIAEPKAGSGAECR